MHLKYRNVNAAFYGLVSLIDQGDIPTTRKSSRVGDVLQIEEPMTITFSHPRERVLFNQQRDANCFFHLFESLHMLAGRNDIASLAYYAANYAKQVQDGDSLVANGAYGYRWRNHVITHLDAYEHVDQLKVIIDHLRRKPDSRRAVLQMWTVEDDLLKIDQTKDCCCNVCVFFSIREVGPLPPPKVSYQKYLDMTVCNRSNDLVWGMLGANNCHFSFLQEYVAACLGVEVGVYNQVTNNLHVYVDNWKPKEWLSEWVGRTQLSLPMLSYDPGPKGNVGVAGPLVRDPETFDRECSQFVDQKGQCVNQHFSEPFLEHVAHPMCWAFYWHKQRGYTEALKMLDRVKSGDWRIAGRNWIEKRRINWEKKQDILSDAEM